MNTIKLLKMWLHNPDNSKAALAAHLGYKSSNTIDKWLGRGKVPRMQKLRVEKFIKRKAKTNGVA
jgi:hypothetical protein